MLSFDPFADFDRLASSWRGGTSGMMPMDIYETEGTHIIKFDLPGIDPGSIELTVENQMLTVTVERAPEETRNANWLIRERPSGRHSRTLRLGPTLNSAEVEANYDNGVLTVTIPMREEAKPHRIQIETGAREALTS